MTSERRLSMVVSIVTSVVTLGIAAACAKRPPASPAAAAATARPALKLAVLAVESDRFPKVAAAATLSLAKARVTGIDRVEVSKVSLEVVQLSIECVEETPTCYEAVGKSLAANRLLFAQIAPAPPTSTKKPARRRSARRAKDVRVTVTLFDVDTRAAHKTAERTFPNESDATAGIDTLIAEATSP